MLFLGLFKTRETAVPPPLYLHLTATSLSALSTSAYRGIVTNADTNAQHLYFRCTTEDLMMLDEVDEDDPEENEAQARELLSFLQQSETDMRMGGLFKKILRGGRRRRRRRRCQRAVFIAVDSFDYGSALCMM